MRQVTIALATLALTAGASVFCSQAKADPYPWCAVYGADDGRESCYYKTFEECLRQIQGLGGFCNQNPGYTGPAPSQRTPARPRPRR